MRPLLEFLDPDTLEFYKGIADYTSLSWENKADGAGSFEIHIPKAIPEMTHGFIVHLCREIPEPYGIITCVKLKNYETVLIGSMLSKIFDWRFMQNDGKDATLTTSEGIGKLICNCAKYGTLENNGSDFFGKDVLFEYPDDSASVAIEANMQTSCLELMTTVAREGNYCFGCTIESGQAKVFAYPYTDKGHTLNTSHGTVGELEYTASCDSERNVFGYSLGDDETGYTYQTYPVFNQPSGTARRVLNIGRYSSVPASIIREKTALLTQTEAVNAQIRLSYPDKFSLGEIITILNPKWGFEKKLAVTAVQEVWEQKYSCNVTFGVPQESVYRKMLRIYR